MTITFLILYLIIIFIIILVKGGGSSTTGILLSTFSDGFHTVDGVNIGSIGVTLGSDRKFVLFSFVYLSNKIY